MLNKQKTIICFSISILAYLLGLCNVVYSIVSGTYYINYERNLIINSILSIFIGSPPMFLWAWKAREKHKTLAKFIMGFVVLHSIVSIIQIVIALN